MSRKTTRQSAAKSKPQGKAVIRGSIGPVEDLESYVKADWWRDIFNANYLRTDGDVVEDPDITEAEIEAFLGLVDVEQDDLATGIDDALGCLGGEGFGVLTEIDVKATLKKKLDVDHRDYVILGACNPKLAHQAISAVPEIGLLLPCNVLVREDQDANVHVSFMDPQSVLGLVDDPGVDPLAGRDAGGQPGDQRPDQHRCRP